MYNIFDWTVSRLNESTNRQTGITNFDWYVGKYSSAGQSNSHGKSEHSKSDSNRPSSGRRICGLCHVVVVWWCNMQFCSVANQIGASMFIITPPSPLITSFYYILAECISQLV